MCRIIECETEQFADNGREFRYRSASAGQRSRLAPRLNTHDARSLTDIRIVGTTF